MIIITSMSEGKSYRFLKSYHILAKTCKNPPLPPNGGSVTVHSEGYMYGKNCSTGGIYLTIPPATGGGCGTPQFTQMDSQNDGTKIVSTYKITINRTPPGGFAALLLTFSQPVTPTSVVITGSVRCLYSLKLSKGLKCFTFRRP